MSIWDMNRTNFDRNIAVVIGINDYQNGIHPLKTAVNDARAIADILENKYEYKEVIRLFPPHGEATWTELNHLLSETLPNKKLTEGDRLLFYFAGHGIARNSEDGPAGYLVPQDAQLGKLESFLPMRDLNSALLQLECHHLLVILDCCFAGNFRWSSSRNVISVPETIHREHYDRFIRHPAWQAITSAAHNQEALDYTNSREIDKDSGSGKQVGIFAFPLLIQSGLHQLASLLLQDYQDSLHSPFAKAFINGLEDMKADFTGDKVIIAPELYLYLRDRLRDEDGYSELQTPGLWPLQKHDRGEFVFILPGFNPKTQLTKALPLNEDNNPYRGLQPYDEKHARFFFGRQELVKELCKKISTSDKSSSQLIAVLGISGSGKSSLVKAGLIPYLRKNDKKEWQILEPMRPGKFPFIALARTISDIANISSDSTSQYVKHLVRSLKKGEFQQLIAPIAAWSQANPQVKLLMIIDQFEELITMSRKANPANLHTKSDSIKQKPQDWLSKIFSRQSTAKNNNQTAQKDEIQQEWQQFLVLLINTLKNCPQLHIVLTLRSDFEARFVESALKEYWNKARFPVRAMRSDELREAIEKPASERALYFEPANAVDRLIDEVGEMPGALPLLSFTLSELYIKLHQAWVKDGKTDRALTIDEQFYQQGGIASSLSYKANKIYEDLSDDAKATMRRVMLRMVEIRGGEAVRRQVFLESELVYTDGQENERVSQVIKSLIEARLIVIGEENQESYVEPAHDFLVRGWDKLEEWIKQEETHLILQRELTLNANKWIDERAVGLLWNDDPRLPFVKKIFESDRNWFNQLETEFIIKSLDRKWNKRLQLICFMASFIGLVSTAAIIAFIQWGLAEQRRIEAEQKTRIATSRQLAAQSQAVFKQYPQRSLLLAVEALKITQDKGDPHVTAAEQILRDGLSQSGGQLLKGHTAGINAVAVSSDSRWLATASEDKTIRLWDLKAKNPAQAPIILHHLGEVRTVAISNDGRWLATGGSDQTVRLWNLSAKDPTVRPRLLKHDHYIWKIAFSPDNHWLVTGTGISGGGTVRLWDLAAKTPEATSLVLYRGKDTILDVTFSKNNRWLATVTEEKNVYIWDLNAKNSTLAPIILAGHQRSVKAVDFSYDSRWLATASEDKTVRLWNLNAKNIAANSVIFYGGNKASFKFVRFSRDNQWLVAADRDKTAHLWNMKAKDPASAFVVLRGHENSISDIAFSFDSHWLVTSSSDKTARMWNLTAENPAAKPITLYGHDASISAITFSPDGRWLIAASSGDFLTDDNSVRLWDLTRNGLFEIPLVLQGLKDDILSSTISSDNRWLVTKHSDIVTRIWDLSLKQRTQIPVSLIDRRQGQQDFGYPAAISSDKRWLVTVSEDKVTRLWDLNFKNPLESDLFKYDLCAYPYQNCLLFYTLYDKLETNKLFTFSSDNRWLATCNNRNCHLWDLTAKQPTANPTVLSNDAEIEAVAFSPNGRWLITGTHLWDLTAKNIAAKPIILNGGVRSVAFSSDGRWLVTGSRDKNVRLWDLTTPHPAAAPTILSAHQDVVRVVAFSPDNRWLVSGSYDMSLRLWDLSAKKPPTQSIVLRSPEHYVTSVSISRDSNWLLAGSVDDKARLWDLTAANPAAAEPIILPTNKAFVSAVAISPDNYWLVIVGNNSSSDNTIHLWPLELDGLINQAHRVAGRSLTREEWEQYLPEKSYRSIP